MSSFQWQRSFYERIIRNDDELRRIRQYIQTNPLWWELDIENGNRRADRDDRSGSPQDRAVQNYYDGIIQGQAQVATCPYTGRSTGSGS